MVVRDRVLLAVVGLHEGGVGQPLLGDGAERPGPAAALAGDVLDQPGEVGGHPPQQRRGDHRDQGQLPLQPEQRAGVDQQPQHRAGAGRELPDHERLDRRGVRVSRDIVSPSRLRSWTWLGWASTWPNTWVRSRDQELLRDPGRQVVVDARDRGAEQVETDVESRDPHQRPAAWPAPARRRPASGTAAPRAPRSAAPRPAGRRAGAATTAAGARRARSDATTWATVIGGASLDQRGGVGGRP